ncbi:MULTISPECIES: hypothetical protein [Klebsiella]|uniref:hypothetical protein n=1 Tax=Klebsiella pneumoniae complex TaxID=3390273 RepID=UPI0007601BCE|nr:MULTISPECIES: hypothetical protein [Klebsiella]MBX4807429.1 hypothetical protein [Klebsiella pneumoniae]MCU8821328.1 hypothetical protein [Klebsiella quasipneumoniae]PNM33722.1 hypothetical protein AL478_013200 [Klebsiella pneumoniae]SCA24863.1 Uncharacterised protein [Klebsiella pneumoniae]
MTDITELAQREKFEAWWEREYKHLESSKYTDAVPHIKYGFWMAYQAGGAEMVEALENAQQRIDELEFIRTSADKVQREFANELGCAGDNESILQAIEDLKQQAESRAVTVVNLQESAYRAGLTAGWNLGLANNNDGFNKCLAAHAAGINLEAE